MESCDSNIAYHDRVLKRSDGYRRGEFINDLDYQ